MCLGYILHPRCGLVDLHLKKLRDARADLTGTFTPRYFTTPTTVPQNDDGMINSYVGHRVCISMRLVHSVVLSTRGGAYVALWFTAMYGVRSRPAWEGKLSLQQCSRKVVVWHKDASQHRLTTPQKPVWAEVLGDRVGLPRWRQSWRPYGV